jgi:hypothetical protein
VCVCLLSVDVPRTLLLSCKKVHGACILGSDPRLRRISAALPTEVVWGSPVGCYLTHSAFLLSCYGWGLDATLAHACLTRGPAPHVWGMLYCHALGRT